ncbi:MAG: AAA family ATPase [Hyphomicrobiales bacterium]|nr:AAA family ATPase [Hyphomicrobiales bacterium]
MTVARIRNGGKAELARALTFVEAEADSEAAAAFADEAFLAARAHVIGLTGPPGVGKSTLINALLKAWRSEGLRVGVIAVDPSSNRSQGALLGDRVRMRTDPEDNGVFVRSLASRGRLGGLADVAFPSIILMRAVFDVVIVETVGVGQSEAEIRSVADTVVMCVQPGSGDSLQFMKAGIMEIPDIAVVTKADGGAMARRALSELEGALSLATGDDVPCFLVSATSGEGFEELCDFLKRMAVSAGGGEFERRRHAQVQDWLITSVRQRYGRAGIEAVGEALTHALDAGAAPFRLKHKLINRLSLSFQVGEI